MNILTSKMKKMKTRFQYGKRLKSIGALNKRKKEINLLLGDGRLYPDFPLAGTTAFELADLFEDQKNILVVGFEDSVYAYKLNDVKAAN